ncbi:MAG: hypothetical protein H0X44_02550 [Acidobacteria bacterium]|nr:hypothetical protein [Acidobacteriota bacterium]
MPGSLDTTNTMLAIIAAVSVLQALVLIGAGIVGFKLYRTATETLREIDERRVKPLAAKVDGILAQVHSVTDRVQQRAAKVEAAIDDTVGRVDQTATKVRSSVNDTVHAVSEAVTGIRSAIVNVLTTESPRTAMPVAPVVPVAPIATSGRMPQIPHTEENVREGGF